MEIIRAQDTFFNQTSSVMNVTTSNVSGPEFTMESVAAMGPGKPGGNFGPPKAVTFTSTMFLAFTLPITFSATILNVSLLVALYKTKKSSLKAKNLIQNNALAHVLFPIILLLDAPYIGELVGASELKIMQCLSGLFHKMNHSLIMAQSACVLTLSVDRLYATLAPLRYHTVGYNRVSTVMMLTVPWVAALIASIIPTLLVDMDTEMARFGNAYFVCVLIEVSAFVEISNGFLDTYVMALTRCHFSLILLFFWW